MLSLSNLLRMLELRGGARLNEFTAISRVISA